MQGTVLKSLSRSGLSAQSWGEVEESTQAGSIPHNDEQRPISCAPAEEKEKPCNYKWKVPQCDVQTGLLCDVNWPNQRIGYVFQHLLPIFLDILIVSK